MWSALEKEMATHSSVLAWRIPGTGEPGGLPSMGSHRVGHDWSNLAAAAAATWGLAYKILYQLSRSVVSNSLWPHGLQHTRPPCPLSTPGVYSNSSPFSQWCHPTISSSVVLKVSFNFMAAVTIWGVGHDWSDLASAAAAAMWEAWCLAYYTYYMTEFSKTPRKEDRYDVYVHFIGPKTEALRGHWI